MVSHYLSSLLLLMVFGVGVHARAERIEPNTFIRDKGTYTFDQNGSSIEVITAKDKKLSLAIDFRAHTPSSKISNKIEFNESGILRGEGWFVFFESPQRLWIFDGKKSLSVVEADNGKTLIKECDKEAASICPGKVTEALPVKVREKVLSKAKQHKAEK